MFLLICANLAFSPSQSSAAARPQQAVVPRVSNSLNFGFRLAKWSRESGTCVLPHCKGAAAPSSDECRSSRVFHDAEEAGKWML